jgi:hypothetical protein
MALLPSESDVYSFEVNLLLLLLQDPVIEERR